MTSYLCTPLPKEVHGEQNLEEILFIENLIGKKIIQKKV
jgi:hypothetical protein